MTDLDLYRDQVERRADLLRERLVHTLDALEQRRHDLLDVNVQARRHPGVVLLFGVASTLVTLGSVALAIQRVRARRARLRRERVEALTRLWRHPDRVARRQHGFFYYLGRAALVGASAAIMMAVAIRSRPLLLRR